jgi:hypothetical protein
MDDVETRIRRLRQGTPLGMAAPLNNNTAAAPVLELTAEEIAALTRNAPNFRFLNVVPVDPERLADTENDDSSNRSFRNSYGSQCTWRSQCCWRSSCCWNS